MAHILLSLISYLLSGKVTNCFREEWKENREKWREQKEKATRCVTFLFGAPDRTRTCTSFRKYGPEPYAYASFATGANINFFFWQPRIAWLLRCPTTRYCRISPVDRCAFWILAVSSTGGAQFKTASWATGANIKFYSTHYSIITPKVKKGYFRWYL